MNRRIALVLAVSILVASGVVGCGWTGFQPANFKAVSKSSAPAQEGRTLEVQSENGAIEVQTWDSNEIQVEATIRATTSERLEATSVQTREENGRIIVNVLWPDGKRLSGEGASLSIRVPKCNGSELKTSNSAIKVAGQLGASKIHTSNGSIDVTDCDGQVDASTSNGAIVVAGAHAPVRAKTSNGKIDISLAADAKGPVDLSSSNGSIKLDVGAAFAGTVDASTSNAACTLKAGDGKSVKGKALTYSFGSGEASKIKTSNGSVTITAAK